MLKTRVEEDTYTITHRDTTYFNIAQNAPETRDNGVVYPSSRVFRSERDLTQRDSIVTRDYPSFIRLGLFESVGLMGTSSNKGLGVGIFGVFPDFDNIKDTYVGQKNTVFSGGLYRIGIGEWRLRWFRDAKDWTIGTSAVEVIAPSAETEQTLFSIAPLYLRKRFFLSEKIPYVAVTPFFGLGYYPSQYVNLGASIDVGSIGGLNIRAYLGYAAGINLASSPQIVSSIKKSQAQTVNIPYAGIGISLLDFLNRVPETEKEWKYHEHSAWDIGLIQLGFIRTGASKSAFVSEKDTQKTTPLFNGMILRLAHTQIAIPILNNQFYAGTALANLVVLGNREWGLGVLPIRVGYWQTILDDELTTEPFIEYNYYPSTFFHIGNKLNLKISEQVSISVILGYASGSASNKYGRDVADQFGLPGDFSRGYFGISIGGWDRIFYPGELRYNR
jgi:hypothetical protein